MSRRVLRARRDNRDSRVTQASAINNKATLEELPAIYERKEEVTLVRSFVCYLLALIEMISYGPAASAARARGGGNRLTRLFGSWLGRVETADRGSRAGGSQEQLDSGRQAIFPSDCDNTTRQDNRNDRNDPSHEPREQESEKRWGQIGQSEVTAVAQPEAAASAAAPQSIGEPKPAGSADRFAVVGSLSSFPS